MNSLEEVWVSHPHLKFCHNWQLQDNTLLLLGECSALVRSIAQSPVLPAVHGSLLNISLIKGAVATTSIEGNTLTEDDVRNLLQGQSMPQSQKYQEQEVKNVLEAFNSLLEQVTSTQQENILVNSDLICRFHEAIGKNLGEPFGAVPGRFRNNNVTIGNHRPPSYEYVRDLIINFCDWLQKEFHYSQGQSIHENIVQAIVTHVIFEWIHPFGDGNGRTGRLLEFYILLRGGHPDITCHILSNHYNQTRPEYYTYLNKAREENDISCFLEYAITGLCDGLKNVLATVQRSLLQITWKSFVYDIFATMKIKNKTTFNRRRSPILSLPIDSEFRFKAEDLVSALISVNSIDLARIYLGCSSRTILRDLQELVEMKLLEKQGLNYRMKIDQLKLEGYFPVQTTNTRVSM